jgi:hypothetical protein
MIGASLGILLAVAGGWECGAGWSRQGELREYTGENLFEYMNGNAEGYLVYGFVKMRGVTCVAGGVTVVVDVSEMKDEEGAYGMLLSVLDPAADAEKLGVAGQVAPRRAVFAKGRYFVELAAEPEGDHAAALREMATRLEREIEGTTSLPRMLGWFPPGATSARLVPKSVLGIRVLERGYVVQYPQGRAFLVRAGLVRAGDKAAETFAQLRRHFAATAPAAVADESFQAADSYLGQGCFFRKGAVIGGFVGAADACARAGALAERVP